MVFQHHHPCDEWILPHLFDFTLIRIKEKLILIFAQKTMSENFAFAQLTLV